LTSSSPSSSSPSTSSKKNKFAYAFYATNDDYACSALNLAQSIIDAGGREDVS
ncbi:hypothetical protein HK102_012354, partial [Quaeritorhiza haematococci]